MNELFLSSVQILEELTAEFLRRWQEEYSSSPNSQATACLFLAVRSTSLLSGMRRLVASKLPDCYEVLARGFLESRDLLLTFRFNEKGTRMKIGYWFSGKLGSSWSAERGKCERFMTQMGHDGSQFGKKWSQMTVLAHPTYFAAHNSVVASAKLIGPGVDRVAEFKIADFLQSVATLIVIATIDFPGLVSLNCDVNHLPNIDGFQAEVVRIVNPILLGRDSDLPPDSYRS